MLPLDPLSHSTEHLDAGEMGSNLPMTPSLAALTPRSQALTIGQILLARALVSDALGEYDMSPISHRSLAPAPTPRVQTTRKSPKSAQATPSNSSSSSSSTGRTPSQEASGVTGSPSVDVNSPPPPPPPGTPPPVAAPPVVVPAKPPPLPSPNSARKVLRAASDFNEHAFN